MSLPSYKEVPVCKRHSLKGLYSVIAEEYDLTDWNSLDVSVRRSKRRVYDYLATELNMVSWYELDVPLRRSTRLLYNFIVVCADPSTPTLTVIVNGTDGALTGATVVIGEESETTGSDGKATFDLEYGDYEATISATGYVTATESLAFRSNHKNFTVVLTGDTPTPTSSTVTIVVTVDGEPAPAGGMFVVSSEELDMENIDLTKILGVSLTGGDGIVRVFDPQTIQPTEEVASIPLGTVYINCEDVIVNDPKTIDSAEQTITYDIHTGGK